jgi:hypothetical protein
MYVCEVYCEESGTVLHSGRFRNAEKAIDWAVEVMAQYDDLAAYRIYPE